MTYDIKSIIEMLPHRYPFLLVDRVIDYSLNEYIESIKNVTMNEPQFTGHFPDNPVMPGVLTLEAMAQNAALLVAISVGAKAGEKEIFFMAVDQLRFRKIIIPGDTITLKANILQSRANVWKFECSAFVGEQIAAETILTAMIKDKTI